VAFAGDQAVCLRGRPYTAIVIALVAAHRRGSSPAPCRRSRRPRGAPPSSGGLSWLLLLAEFHG